MRRAALAWWTARATELEDDEKEIVFLRKIRQSTVPKFIAEYYDRIPIAHADHCYQYLEDSVYRRIDKLRRDKNIASYSWIFDYFVF